MYNILRHIWISTWKETLLLRRDRAGLVVLFFMPAILVVIITLVQENVMELTGEKDSRILFYDEDNGLIGQRIRRQLEETERIALVELDVSEKSRIQAVASVNRGDYQVLVVIPRGTSGRLRQNAQNLFADAEEHKVVLPADTLPVYFDPSVLPGFRSGILAVVRISLFRVEMELKIEALQEKTTRQLAQLQSFSAKGNNTTMDLGISLLDRELLKLTTEQTGKSGANAPSAVQHNIPAWALFGLFFTCIPLAGSLLVERNSGIWIRLMSMPASAVSLLIGKIIAYVAVCFCQIFVIVLIGFYLFPLLGLPAFTLTGNIGVLTLISFCCGLAACGYGVFLGSICSSLEQASMFGSISIVIAASLGGTLVPTYAMPGLMQRISGFSPMNWGLASYQDVLLRGFSLMQISGSLLKLVLFFLLMLTLSWRFSRLRR